MDRLATLRAVYPKASDSGLQRLAETCERIEERTRAWQAEEEEKRLALAWCRSNGNPHREAQSMPLKSVGVGL